jgi:uncharacterized protein YcbX
VQVTEIGRVESVWRYPVKSMCGEAMDEISLKQTGVEGDRLYAFHSSGSPADFPYFTGRNQTAMILYRPRFRDPDQLHLGVEVETPEGDTLAVDDPRLIAKLRRGINEEKHLISLMQSDAALTDCQPVSLFSIQTAEQLSRELGKQVDKRRFRANIYLDLASGEGFDEDRYVGQSLRIGDEATVRVLERDPRCKMITLHPDTAQAMPEVLAQVVRKHDRTAGVYASVTVEGRVRPGDPVRLLA